MKPADEGVQPTAAGKIRGIEMKALRMKREEVVKPGRG
jgi:hypothetical protein